jgi:hypothetical protein
MLINFFKTKGQFLKKLINVPAVRSNFKFNYLTQKMVNLFQGETDNPYNL